MHPELVHMLANQRYADLLDRHVKPRRPGWLTCRGRLRVTIGGWLITLGVRLSLSSAPANHLQRPEARL